MKKRGLIIAFSLILILSSTVIADSETWVISKAKSEINDLNARELSYLLFVTSDDKRDASLFLNALEKLQDEEGCYPDGSCTVLDTATVAYAKNKLGIDFEKEQEWLLDARVEIASEGNYLLQVEAPGEINCTVTSGAKKFYFDVLQDRKIKQCSDYFIDLKNCAGFNSIENLEVLCEPGKTVSQKDIIISIVRKTGEDSYFLDKEENGIYAKFKIKDYCYGKLGDVKRRKGVSSCDVSSTAMGLLALEGTEYGVFRSPYLESSSKTPFENFAVYSVVGTDASVAKIVESLGEDGSYQGDGFQTAWAFLALSDSNEYLEQKDETAEWLFDRLEGETGIDGQILDTAAALMAFRGYSFVGGGGDTGPVAGQGYCGDGFVDPGEDCDGDNDDQCPGQCGEEGTTDECECLYEEDTCTRDLDCDIGQSCVSGECKILEEDDICVSDSDCGRRQECVRGECQDVTFPRCGVDSEVDEVCECGGEIVSSGYCCSDGGELISEDSECGGGGILFWIISVIVIILAGGFVFILYKKGLIKIKKKTEEPKPMKMPARTPKPKFKQAYNPNQQAQRPMFRQRPVDQDIEDKLDKGIEEAQKLLRKR